MRSLAFLQFPKQMVCLFVCFKILQIFFGAVLISVLNLFCWPIQASELVGANPVQIGVDTCVDVGHAIATTFKRLRGDA